MPSAAKHRTFDSHLAAPFLGPLALIFLGLALAGCRDSTSAQTLPVVKSGLKETDDHAKTDDHADSASALGPDERRIRILLSDHVQNCRLQLHEPFVLRDLTGERPPSGRLEPMTLELRLQDQTILIPALDLTLDHPVEICPDEGEPTDVELVGEPSRAFPGRLRFLPAAKGAPGGSLINLVDVEDYLVGVVAAELHQGFGRKACRAQAIASRTYAWYWMSERQGEGDWDVRATEGSQVYLGLGRADQVPEAARAVRDTRGLVLTWNGSEGRRIFCTFYSSTCGGRTQPVGPVMRHLNIPPLAGGVQCDDCRDSPAYHWGPLTLPKAEITDALHTRYDAFRKLGTITRIDVTQEEEGGRVVRLRLYDSRGRSLPLEAENFRLAVDPRGRRLRSTWFTLETREDAFCFLDGRGFGHGVGMCQYGAQGMAERGASAIEILRHYYPQSQIVRAY